MQKISIEKIKFRSRCYLNFSLHKLIRMLSPSRRYKSLTIIPHEGLGDLISILPALKALRDGGVKITLVTDFAKWSQLKNAFIDVPDVNIIQAAPNSSYSIPVELEGERGSALIPLGYFSKFSFIIDYPYSFFWELGVDRKVVTKFLCLKPYHDDFQLPDFYAFVDLGTSKGVIASDYASFYENKVTVLSNTDVVIDRGGNKVHLALSPSVSFHQKIFIALRSQVIICSDAALFNAVIRMSVHPKILVHTRKSLHSHCKEIYGSCKFDGGIYEFPARSEKRIS